jgi:hypothetical protein
MATIAELVVALGVDSSGLDSGLGEVPGKLDRVGQQMATSGATLTKTATLPLLAAAGGLFALAGAQEDAEVLLKSSYDSMAAAGWTTLDELQAQASAFQESSTFGDENILKYQSVLLTFGNVTGDVFTDATRLGLDMSAKLGTDLQSTAIQLGKALNDPVTGMTALTRSGVSFSQEQKDMVKTMVEAGDIAGAQAVILGELERQFGGTAEAMAQTGTGQAKQAMNALGDAGESIGAFLIPVISKLAGGLKTLANWFQNLSPAAQEWIVRIGAIVAAVGPALWIGGKLIGSFGKIGRAFSALSKLVAANPWVLLIAATVALVVIIVKNWDTIKAFLTAAWEAIKEVATKVWDGIKSAVSTVVDFLVNLFLNWTLPGLIIKHWDTIRDGAVAVKDWVIDKFLALVTWFKSLPRLLWEGIKTLAAMVWDPIKNAATIVKEWVVERFQALVDWFKELPGKIADAFKDLAETITAPFRTAFDAIGTLYDNTIGKIPGLGGGGGSAKTFDINKFDVPTFHTGGTYRAPTPGGQGLAMLQDGERVTPAGGTTQPPIVIGNVYGWDDFVRKVRAAGVDINRLGMAG